MTRFALHTLYLTLAVVLTLGVAGCGPDVRDYELQEERTALKDARQILEGYVAGNPVTSEVDDYPAILERLRAEDPAAAEIVSDAFDKIKANPAGAKSTAQSALTKLDAAAPPAS